MSNPSPSDTIDYVIIGSGFGGSVSAMRLTEKGYRVLVLERGKRYRDQDFAKTNWSIWKYLWLPAARWFGILQISPLKHVIVLHGCGFGGGSLGYANVLMQPSDDCFRGQAWQQPVAWGEALRSNFDLARRMLGVAQNPRLGVADHLLREIAAELGQASTFQPTAVGTFFGQPGQEGQAVPDPYFGGEGPARNACTHCGACMVGCRHNAKNTLAKNYLYFAEKWGAEVRAEAEVRDIRPLPAGQPDGARYEVIYRRSTAWLHTRTQRVRARNVIVSAGALGTLRLLFRCRDLTRSLPRLSQCLGDRVRTNSEALLGVTSRDGRVNYSEGIAITSIFYADPVTTIEPVRYPSGSDVMRFLAGPLIDTGSFLGRVARSAAEVLRRPRDLALTHVMPGWARRSVILLVMQTEDTRIRLRLGRSAFTAWLRNLVSEPDEGYRLYSKIDVAHKVTRRFAQRVNGVPAGTLNESLLNIPMTAHIIGGCTFGRDASEGVIGVDGQVHNYPGLYVIDGSTMPGNPGVNPSLTITAMAEFAMSQVPSVPGRARPPLFSAQASDSTFPTCAPDVPVAPQAPAA